MDYLAQGLRVASAVDTGCKEGAVSVCVRQLRFHYCPWSENRVAGMVEAAHSDALGRVPLKQLQNQALETTQTAVDF